MLAVVGLLALALAACSSDNDVRSVGGTADGGSTPMASPSPPVSQTPPTDATTPVDGTDTPTTPAPGNGDTCDADPLTPAGDGAGDRLFPDLGNPGIDVHDYAIDLSYDPATDALGGSVTITIVATSDLASFTLDAVGPVTSAVTVDGLAATFEQTPTELVITPASPVPARATIVVRVDYTVPAPHTISGADGVPIGWFDTGGGSYVLNEPDGARTWLPSNDHPSDKAAFLFKIHVPAGLTAIANGEMTEHITDATGETWVWVVDEPMTTYLIQLLTGDYEIVDGTGPNGLPLTSVVLRSDRTLMQPYIDVTPEQIAFFEPLFGPYPLDRYGIAMSDSDPGLAMETFGRSLFSRLDFATGTLDFTQQLLLSHELAHQWFGDAVSPARWQDIWLNESFATYGEWLWLDHIGMEPLQAAADDALASRPNGSTADPTAAGLFSFNSYDGGAVVLHALRATIGDDAFFELLQQWVATNDGRSCTTGGFIAMAEQVSGQDLSAFFDEWLFATQLPTEFPVSRSSVSASSGG